MTSKPKGLYRKFDVKRVDPEAQKRHPNCAYFVLDLYHDPHALPALAAYADSVENENPELAEQLRLIATQERR